MNCWHCEHELIWGGDSDLEDDEDHDMMTNLSCPACEALVIVYHVKEAHWSKKIPDTNIKVFSGALAEDKKVEGYNEGA